MELILSNSVLSVELVSAKKNILAITPRSPRNANYRNDKSQNEENVDMERNAARYGIINTDRIGAKRGQIMIAADLLVRRWLTR